MPILHNVPNRLRLCRFCITKPVDLVAAQAWPVALAARRPNRGPRIVRSWDRLAPWWPWSVGPGPGAGGRGPRPGGPGPGGPGPGAGGRLVAQLVPGRAAGAWSRSWCLVAQLVPVAVFVFVCRPVPCLYVPARTYKHPGPRSWDRGRWPWAASPGPWPPVRAPWRVGKGPATRGPKKRAGCKLRGL
jgi:hypothetical protein